MEISSKRMEGVLIFFVSGRLDAYGAQELGEEVRNGLHDDDRYLVIDITGAPYLSSGGIRIFNFFRQEMKRRKGRFALTGIGEYSKKVLAIAGFTTLFETFATAQEAVDDLKDSAALTPIPGEPSRKQIERDGVILSIEPGQPSARPVLRVLGSLDALLHARLTADDIRSKTFQEIEYSLGLGALGTDLADALPLLGEMITLHGSMVWLPTDGHGTPDFLTPESAGDVPVYTGYNIALEGPFQEYAILDSDNPKGVPLGDIYRAIFAGAQQRAVQYQGVVALAIWGILIEFASSGLKKSPIASSAPPNGASILDPSQVKDWFASDAGTAYYGDTLLSFGIGVDLGYDLSHFAPEDLSSLYYANPFNQVPAGGMYLHNHGVVFRNVPYNASLDLSSQMKKIVTEGEFIEMRHLLDSTRLRRAKIGIAYIQDIRRET